MFSDFSAIQDHFKSESLEDKMIYDKTCDGCRKMLDKTCDGGCRGYHMIRLLEGFADAHDEAGR
jgi:hypothetical protein